MGFIFNIFSITRERRYKILLCLASFLFLAVSFGGTIIVYRSYCHCKEIEKREERQREYYKRVEDKFEVLREYVKELGESSDFMEHVAREHLQIIGENELLFRFE
jgi:cell division protein FtsB